MKFRPDSDERACGTAVEHGGIEAACMRTNGHAGSHMAIMRDAAIADGVCFGCRERRKHKPDCWAGKPHGRDCPHRCSMCRGAEPRRVLVIDYQLCIDGQPTGRSWDHEPRHVTARRRAKR